MYRSTLSLTSALDVCGWSTPFPGHFTPGKGTQYPLYRRLGGPQGQSGQVWKIFPPPGFELWTVYIQKLRKIVLIIPTFELVHSVLHNWGDHECKIFQSLYFLLKNLKKFM